MTKNLSKTRIWLHSDFGGIWTFTVCTFKIFVRPSKPLKLVLIPTTFCGLPPPFPCKSIKIGSQINFLGRPLPWIHPQFEPREHCYECVLLPNYSSATKSKHSDLKWEVYKFLFQTENIVRNLN